MHPLHPMLVHVPITCLVLTPVSDGAAAAFGEIVLWKMSALIAALGVIAGLAAATAGAIDMHRAQGPAARIVAAHAGLMGVALSAAAIGLVGRVSSDHSLALPPPHWAIGAGIVAAMFLVAGAWFGGELVYGHGVGTRTAGRHPPTPH